MKNTIFRRSVLALSAVVLTFYLGAGDTFDESKAKALPPGSTIVNPAKTHHFALTKDHEVVIQVHGTGPWDSNPVTPPAK